MVKRLTGWHRATAVVGIGVEVVVIVAIIVFLIVWRALCGVPALRESQPGPVPSAGATADPDPQTWW